MNKTESASFGIITPFLLLSLFSQSLRLFFREYNQLTHTTLLLPQFPQIIYVNGQAKKAIELFRILKAVKLSQN